MGHESELFALTIDDDLRGDVRPFGDRRRDGGRRHDLSFRAAVADDRGVRAPAARPRPAVSQRHAGALFRAVRPGLFRLAALGRQELATLAGRVDLALGDSEFNRRELESLGFAPTGRLADRRRHGPRSRRRRRVRRSRRSCDDGLIELPVRRPDRAEQEDRGHHPAGRALTSATSTRYYRFIFVGRYDVVPRYYATIRALMAEYQLLTDRFFFTGPGAATRSWPCTTARRASTSR